MRMRGGLVRGVLGVAGVAGVAGVVSLLGIACARAPRGASSGGAGPPPQVAPPPATGPAQFDQGVVRAFHRCEASAPALLSILMQASGRSVRWFELDLQHGPTDPVPRQFVVGGASVHFCGPDCSGTVWLEALQPGQRARGRYRLALGDGTQVDEPFDVPWEGELWAVQLCPTSPGGHGR